MIYLLNAIIAIELLMVGGCIALFIANFDRKPKKSNRQRIEDLEKKIEELKKLD